MREKVLGDLTSNAIGCAAGDPSDWLLVTK
jgi:hypothetical protein